VKIFEIIQEIEKALGTDVKKFLKENEDRSLGEYSLTVAFKIAKESKKDLNKVANELAEKLRNLEFFEKVEVLKGYINLYLNFKKILKDILKQKIEFEKEDKKIIVEHTSVNPNKALHIGHLRNSVIGDCIQKLLKKFYKEVCVTNYIEDTGQQVAEILLAFQNLGFETKVSKKFDIYCSEVYPKVHEIIEKSEELKELLSKKIKDIEENIDENSNEIIMKILKGQLQTLKKFNINYDFLIRESDIIRLKVYEKAIESLKNFNLIKEKDRLYVLFDGKEVPITRSDGSILYLGKDIAFAMWKLGLINVPFKFEEIDSTKISSKNGELINWKNFDISINVIDVRQSDEQRVVKKIVEKISGKSYIHFPYEVVALSSQDEKILHMSGRKGIFINVDDLVEIVKERIKNVNQNLKEDIIEKLAINTIKYELLKVSPEKMIVFDINKSIKLEGNTAIYILYSYVRLLKILEKAGNFEESFDIKELSKEEKNLLFYILNFPLVLKSIKESLRINLICEYIYNVAEEFNKFYEKHRVLDAEKDIRNFRLNLLKSLKNLYEEIFEIIGFFKIDFL